MRRPTLPLLLVVLLFGLPAQAEDEGEAGRAYARSVLLKQAHAAVGGHGTSDDALAAMRRGLAADIAFAERVEAQGGDGLPFLKAFRPTIEERLLLVGHPASGEGEEAQPATEGALQEAVQLGHWLRGKAGCAIEVTTAPEDGRNPRAYAWPPEPEALAPDPQIPDPVVPKQEAGAAEEPGSGPEKNPAGDTQGEAPGQDAAADGAKPDSSGADGDAKKKVSAAASAPGKPMDVDTWAKKYVRVKEGGSLRGRTLKTAVCTTVENLVRAEARQPVYVHKEVHGLKRYAMQEDGYYDYNVPFVALRVLQADERNKAMQSDKPPPSLVDGAMVREKAKDTARFHKQLGVRKAQRQHVVDRLDQMVDALDGWKTQAALLAREIEERHRAVPPPDVAGGEDEAEETPGKTQAELDLRLAQARETLASIEITLLYLTAVRAEERLELLDRLLRACAEETTGAEQVHAHYEGALQRLRSERRLDRLNSDERMLAKWIRDEEESQAADGSMETLRLIAYRAIKRVNEVVQEAVVRRRAMVSGGTEEETARGAQAGGSPEDEAEEEASTSLLSSVILEPGLANWDVKYIQIAQRELEDQALRSEFGASLVAAHYAAVDERIRALVQAFRIAQDEGRLRRDFEGALSAAKAALQPLQNDLLVSIRNLPAMVEAASGDFAAAVAGIAEQRGKNEKRLEALLDYRALLLRQGTRSLLIRVDRDLSKADVGDVLWDTTRAFETASDWVLVEGDGNLSDWLRGTWLRVLLLLGLLVGVFFLARLGRRLVDRWIKGRVAAYPALQTHGASVREERERARERREADASAAETTSLERVLQQEGPEASEDTAAEEATPSPEATPSSEEMARPGREAGNETGGRQP